MLSNRTFGVSTRAHGRVLIANTVDKIGIKNHPFRRYLHMRDMRNLNYNKNQKSVDTHTLMYLLTFLYGGNNYV